MKVKRTKSIYSSRRRRMRPLAVIIMLIGAACLIFIGWSIAEPLQKLFAGQLKPAQNVSSKVSSSSAVSSSGKNSSSSTVSPSKTSEVKGIYLSGSYLTDSTALDGTLAAAKSAGLNLAIVELKDENGKIYFGSQTARDLKLIGSDVPDAAAAASKIKSEGMEPAAKITCFKDDAAARAMRDAAVKYLGNHNYLWLESGKKAWLNPCSDQAAQYIAGLAKDAVAMGYTHIYLDGVQFPTGGNPSKSAWFGDTTVSKEDALKNFVSTVTQAVKSAGGKVTVMLPNDASIGQGTELSGQDQSIFGYGADSVSPNLCPSLFGRSVQIDSNTISKPDLTPGDTVSAAAQYLSGQAGKENLLKTVPFIQAYTNTSIGSGYSKTYTSEDVAAQIAALKNAGITSFILYKPEGTYDTSLISGAGSKQ